MREIMRNTCTASGGTLDVTKAFTKLKNSNSFENLNDAAIISKPMFATCKVKMERIILFMRNRESAFVFRRRVPAAKFCENFSRKRKLRFSLLSDAYNYNIDAYIKWNTVFSS